jgi:cell fate regulator YaaT (PSP1 superfamily)
LIEMHAYVVGVRFQKVGKVYHFDASSFRDIVVGDFTVVETSRGSQLGQVVQILEDLASSTEGSWKPILRKATARDLVLRQTWQQKEVEAMINCRAKASEIKLEGIKIVAAEFSFDGSRLSFLYSTEGGDKLDVRALRRAMQRAYPQTQIEMHQIGPRDVAKILGGMGACGLETRCCSKFLTDFSPISIKMAKEQGISLTPSEITGMCGRLRCCLVYEYEQYVEARKRLPKRGKRVVTPIGDGKVVDVLPLKESVMVVVEGKDGQHEFLKHEIQPWDELEALRQKSQAPCDRHEAGECDCGRQSETGKAAEQMKEEDSGEETIGKKEKEDSSAWDDTAVDSKLEKGKAGGKRRSSQRGKPWERQGKSGKQGKKRKSSGSGKGQ